MKSGIDYFPLDVCLDDNIKLIEAEFGLTGFAVIVKLYQKIYGQNGYYCEFTKDVAVLFAEEIKAGVGVVSEIVSASIRRGIFDKTLYEKYGILTSRGIQKRYFEAVSRRKNVCVEKAYLLVSDTQNYKNVCISEKNVYILGENVDISEQSKVKESKVNNIITIIEPPGAATQSQTHPPSLEEVEDYCRRKKLTINPKRFFEYYSKQGWKTKSGKPVDDWYSLAENWHKKQTVDDEHEQTDTQEPKESHGSFDTDDFFEAALKRSYGK